MKDTNQQPSSERSFYSFTSVLKAPVSHLQAAGNRLNGREGRYMPRAEVLTTMNNNITNDVLFSHLVEVP